MFHLDIPGFLTLTFVPAGLLLSRRNLFGLAALPKLPAGNTEPEPAETARRLLVAWRSADAAWLKALDEADALSSSVASYDAVRAMDERANAKGDVKWAIEDQIARLAYASVGRPVPPADDRSETPPVVLAVDGWLFICGPSCKPGKLLCHHVVPPEDVVSCD